MWYVMTIRHEVVYKLEQNVRMAPGQHCYMCDVESSVVCHDEIVGIMTDD
jgi:hypothetical protein